MKLAYLVAAVALVSCGGEVAGPSVQGSGSGSGEQTSGQGQTGSGTGVSPVGDDAGGPECVGDSAGGWSCAGIGQEPSCPGGVVAGVSCLDNVYATNPTMPAHVTSAGFTCLACANGEGTVWTCDASGWAAGETVTCGG